ncbi:hypothetical protein KQI84_14125 [bacterium]|nr:hypothetical protein [bacterium]
MKLRLAVLSLFILPILCGQTFAQNPGDVLYSLYPPNTDKARWTFDETLGRHYVEKLGEINTYDRGGSHLSTISFSYPVDYYGFHNAFGYTTLGACFVANDDTWYVLDEDLTTMTVWQLGTTTEGEPDITKTDTIDFSTVLSTGCVNAIDRANDGSWWVICGSSIYNLSPDATAIRQQVTRSQLFTNIFGVPSPNRYGLSPYFLAVDRVSSDLYVMIIEDGYDYGKFYRLDGQTFYQKGRFDGAYIGGVISSCRLIGSHDGFMFLNAKDANITQRSLQAQTLPDVTSFDLNQEGVLWTFPEHSASYPVNWTLAAYGGGSDIEALRVYDGVFIGPRTYDAGTVTGYFRRDVLDGIENPYSLFTLQNTNNQISTPIQMAIPLRTYPGTIPFYSLDPSYGPFGDQFIDKVVKWGYSGVAPRTPINAWVEFIDGIPWVGGKRYGIKEVQASAKAEIASVGDGNISVAGGGEFLVGSGVLRTELGGGVINQLTPEGLDFTGGLVTVKLAGTVKEEAKMSVVFPQLAPLKQWPFIGSAVAWLDQRAKLIAAITLGIDAESQIKVNENSDLSFDGKITGYIALTITAVVDVLGDYMEATAFGEGKGSVTLVPDETSGLRMGSIGASLLIGAKLRIYNIIREFQTGYTFTSTYPARSGVPPSKPTIVSDSGWQYTYAEPGGRAVKTLEERPHIITRNPFHEFERQRRARGVPNDPTDFDTEADVIGGLPDGTRPVIGRSTDGFRYMVLWEQPIEGRPATQATDIWYSYFDGMSFSDPAPVCADAKMDFKPDVGYYKISSIEPIHERFVAMWERVAIEDLQPSGDPQADNETMMQNLIPAYATFNPETRTWTEVREIPITGKTAFNVQSADARFGQAWMLWLESENGNYLPWDLSADPISSGRLGGITLHMLEMGYDFEFGNHRRLGDEDPEAGVPDDILEYAAALYGNTIEIVITRMEDVTSVDPLEGDIRAEKWRHSVYVGPIYNTLYREFRQPEPTMTFHPMMHAYLAGIAIGWVEMEDYKDTGIMAPAVHVGDLDQGQKFFPEGQPAPHDPGDENYSRGASLEGLDMVNLAGIGFGFIGPGHEVDGGPALEIMGLERAPGPLSPDRSFEKNFVALPDANDSLLVGFWKADLTSTPTTAEIDGVTTGVIERDLAEYGTFSMLSHESVRDLAVGKTGLQGGIPEPGNEVTVFAEVKNIGDLSAWYFHYSLYAMPPDARELIPIVENERTNTGLSGNSSMTITARWVIPDDQDYSIVAVIDPDNLIDEYSEDNNMTTEFTPMAPPDAVISVILGRTTDPQGLDFNNDNLIDPADIVTRELLK